MNVDFYRHWNLTESTDLLFALGFGYMSSTSKYDGTKTEISGIMFPKYTFAVETNLLDWGKIRAGLNENHLLSSSTKVGGNEYALSAIPRDSNISMALFLASFPRTPECLNG